MRRDYTGEAVQAVLGCLHLALKGWTAIISEAVIVTVTKAVAIFCLCAMALIVVRALLEGRGMESVFDLKPSDHREQDVIDPASEQAKCLAEPNDAKASMWKQRHVS